MVNQKNDKVYTRVVGKEPLTAVIVTDRADNYDPAYPIKALTDVSVITQLTLSSIMWPSRFHYIIKKKRQIYPFRTFSTPRTLSKLREADSFIRD